MKMRLLILFLIGFTLAFGVVVVPAGICPGERDILLSCFDQVLNVNFSGGSNVTTTELDAFFTAGYSPQGCLPKESQYQETYNTTTVFSQCDVNMDGVLNLDDWNAADACLQSQGSRLYVCRMCYQCGWSGPVPP